MKAFRTGCFNQSAQKAKMKNLDQKNCRKIEKLRKILTNANLTPKPAPPHDVRLLEGLTQ